jgi:hypothetical protein
MRARRGGALVAIAALVAAGGVSIAGTANASDGGTAGGRILGIWEVQSLNGANNNPLHQTWGMAGTNYPRAAAAHYADGLSQPFDGPNPRYISNRIVNDSNQNLYTPRGVSQWAFVWGQFLDHTIAQRLGRRMVTDPGEPFNIPVDASDPMDEFPNTLGFIPVDRSRPAEGTGVTNAREQVNTLSSYIDAEAVYSNDPARLAWLRQGPGLFMVNNYLPRRDSKGDPEHAPNMVAGGRLFTHPEKAAVAGDPRANENPALLATQTLFAREHNRLVSLLPRWMSDEDKFQIARAVVIAEQQYITYTEFLPAVGVKLPHYTGYKAGVDADVTNEFATVGYRAHSQIRAEFKIEAALGRYSQSTLDALVTNGVIVTPKSDHIELLIPLGEDAFFNPDLLELLQLGPMLEGIGLKPQANNDEQVSNLLRSFPFQIPIPPNPTCSSDPSLPPCIVGANDLVATDIARGRDHGMPTYNQLRAANGLPPVASFRQITGEASESFPADPLLTPGNEINDPQSLDFTALYDAQGHPTTPAADNATSGVRRTPLAARLKAIYGTVDNVDAFVGMISEKHRPGTEFGETQLAIWKKQFTALRDGDRFFYGNDPLLKFVRVVFGIDYRKNLGDLIALNTDIPRQAMARNVFFAQETGPSSVAPEAVEVLPEITGPYTRNGGLFKGRW